VFRLGLTALVGGLEGIDVVGEAEDAASACTQARELKPDVVIMDVQLPDASGIEATKRLLAADASLGILVLTMFDDDDSVHAAIRAGARGYLVKGARPDEIERAIRAVADGEVILGSAAARAVAQAVTHGGRRRLFPELSEREEEVLELLADGVDNRGIAARLFISDKTVRNHVHNILGKLGASSRSEAAARVRDRRH
jgi:DNA-binding NarL/FixJ family response regulator